MQKTHLGPQNAEASASYIQYRFQSQNKNEKRQIYSHQTCATDTGQVQFVLDSAIDMIIEQNLKSAGLY